MVEPETTILGDWGSTRLRLWLVRDGAIRANSETPGLFVAGAAPKDVLAAALEQLGGAGAAGRIVLCGMAGAREGLQEVPYVALPAGPADWRGGAMEAAFASCRLTILPGLATAAPKPDVMRGEETQVFGLLTLQPRIAEGRHVAILPGTHSKWVTIDNGRIAGFATFITGELLAALEGSSLVGADAGLDEDGFAEGLQRAGNGDALAASLFEARAGRLLHGRTQDWSRGFLSGLLIGAEIAAGLREARPEQVLLIGQPNLTARYRKALAAFGVDSEAFGGDTCVIAGLEAAVADAG